MTAFKITNDPTNETYPWLVLDGDGDEVECFATRAEAIAEIKERNEEEEREELIEAIDLEELTTEQLRQIAKMRA